MTLKPGDRLVAFSDGITEARNPADEEFGDARLEQLLARLHGRGASDVCQVVLEQVKAFTGGRPQSDDLTIIAAHVGTSR